MNAGFLKPLTRAYRIKKSSSTKRVFISQYSSKVIRRNNKQVYGKAQETVVMTSEWVHLLFTKLQRDKETDTRTLIALLVH